ncbi:(5-formylfuran-3-yl)methyl phosphate synthase [Methylomonas sp. MgM2]
MTGMLASVNSLEEALLLEPFNVDVIDLKQPAKGALGALPVGEVAEIVSTLNPETVISATVGDLPMQPDLISDAVQAMAQTGVDYIKIGFFPGGDWPACIERLADVAARRHALIAVLFADVRPDMRVIPSLQRAGFKGVMLDTMDKNQASLTEAMSAAQLKRFVETAKSQGLLTGLAGSLRLQDIDALLPLQADYLGFRGALCQQRCRTAQLDPEQIAVIRHLINGLQNPALKLNVISIQQERCI